MALGQPRYSITTYLLVIVMEQECIQFNIQMQEAFLRSQKLKYNEETYNQWSQLPPNIPLTNTSTIPLFLLTFPKIIYLNQINTDKQSIQLKLGWWGMKKPHSLLYSQISTCQGKYLICTPMERLLSYFNDMNLLSIEVCNKYRVIGKAYLNFLVLKGWRGEHYEGNIDIKQGIKKIGELAFTMQIKNVEHPFLMNQSVKETDKRQKEFSIRINPYSGQQIRKKSKVSDQRQHIYHIIPQIEQSNRRQETSKKATMKSIIRQQEKDEQQVSYDRNEIHQRNKNKIDYLSQKQSIGRGNNIGKYQAELFRLVQDYNLIIGKHNNFPVSSPASQLQNNIQIQIVKIDAKLATQVQIHVPLINRNANIYRLSQGGIIKLQLPSSITENQLMNYVRYCVVSFKQQKLEGSIKLSKILAHCNQIIQIPLFQKEDKRGAKKQKGSCWIKSIPPPRLKEQGHNELVAEIQTKIKQPQTKKQQIKVKQEEYLLLNIKAFNSIQKNNRTPNAFLRFYCDEELIGQTATLWNKRQDIIFNERVTCKIWQNRLIFQLCDRQKSIIKLASGFVDLTSPLGINLQIPLRTKHMGSQIIIGYISLDYFKNGFQSITKMAQFLNQKQNINPINPIIPAKHQEAQHQKQHVIDELSREQQQSIIHDITQQNKENDMSDNKMQQQITQIKTDPKKMPHYQSKLSLLQIYNKIFTYCFENHQIMTMLLQKNEHKVTEFLQILNLLVSRSIVNYSNLNQLITHFLFKSNNSNNINKVNTVAFRECFQAFQTYYAEIAEEKDEKLAHFLHILQDKGLSINDLEFQLRSSKNIWDKLHQLFAYQKGKHINIIEDLKRYLQKKPKVLERRELIANLSGPQLCDILRKYQVYQTTSGSEIEEQLLSQRIYRSTILLLQDIQPNIELYSYNELISFLQTQQISLSVWQLLNLREYLTNYGIKRTLPKYPQVYAKNIQNESGRFKQLQENAKLDSKRNGAQSNRPGISKSPTFGYLHPPEHIKQVFMTSENYMMDSLALKMQNLAISPINYNSDQTKYQQFKAMFSNLKYTITDLYVNDQRIYLNNFESQANYRSNSINQPPYSRQIGSSDEVIKKREESNISENYSQYAPSKKEEYRITSMQDNQNFQIKLANIEKGFSYQVQILFQQIEQVIQLQCLHNEWAAIVSEDGDYLGGVLIS